MALDYTNKRMRLMSVLVPLVFWMAAHYFAAVDSQYSGAQYPSTVRYGQQANPSGQLPYSYPAQHYSNQYANPAQYDRHRRYYDSANTVPCSNYFCSRLDFALLTVIRPQDRPAENCTAVGPCATGQVFVCTADPVVQSYSAGYSSYGAGGYASAPSYATAASNCPAFVCNANFTAIVTGCDPMNCTVIGSTPLSF